MKSTFDRLGGAPRRAVVPHEARNCLRVVILTSGGEESFLRAPQGDGCLVFIASTNSDEGEALQAPYNGSKGGLLLLTKTLARELGAHGIRSNAVGPGFIRTRLSEQFLSEPSFIHKYLGPDNPAIPLRRLGFPADVTGPALFLASRDAAFVNGAMLLGDSGQLA